MGENTRVEGGFRKMVHMLLDFMIDALGEEGFMKLVEDALRETRKKEAQ